MQSECPKGSEKWLTPTVLALFITSIAMGSLEFSVIGIQTELAQYFQKSEAGIGLLVAAFAFGLVIGTPVILMLTAKIDRFRIMVTSMTVLTVLTFLSSYLDVYEVMLLNRFVSGFLSGATISCSCVLCTALFSSPNNRAKAMTLVFAGYSISSVFIIPVLEYVAHLSSWHDSYALINGIQIASLILLFVFVPRNAAPWTGSRSDEIKLFKDRKIVLALIAPMFLFGGVYMVYSYITPIFVEGYGIPEGYIYIFLFLFGVMGTLSNAFSAYVESHGGLTRVKYLLIIQVAILALVSVTLMTLKEELWFVGVAMMMLVGAMICISSIPLQSYYIRVARNEYPGGVNLSACFNSIAVNLGIMAGSVLGGQLLQNGLMNYLGFVGAASTMVAILLLVYLERSSDGKYMTSDPGS